MNALEGRKIVVMGGTSGIGLAAAQQLSNQGASVFVTGRDAEKVSRVRQDHPALKAERVDASSVQALSSFYQSLGPFDDLVLSLSGGKGAGQFTSLDPAEMLGGLQDKFLAQFLAAQTALPVLRKDGSLTFITAFTARAAIPGTVGLAAINGAIEAMVKPLAKELRPLRVNAISPGAVETSWWDRVPREIRQSMLAQTAAGSMVGRNGTAEELGSAVAFIVANGFVSGTVLEVDGGLRLA